MRADRNKLQASLEQFAGLFRKIPFKHRLFCLFGIMGIISALFAFLSALANDLPTGAVWSSFICFLVMLANAVFYCITRNYNIASIVCCVSLDIVMFPLLFWFSGGAHSGMPLYFLLGITVTTLILEGQLRLLMVAASLIIDTICFVLYYDYGNVVYQLSTEMQKSDVITSFWIVALFFTLVLMILMREFGKEQKRLIAYGRRLKEQNYIDELTGLYNHRFAKKQLHRFFQTQRDVNCPLTVVMLDIDYFKRVNDVFGHLCGNEVLIRFSQILAAHMSAGCYAIRYGGEEFLLFLEGMEAEKANALTQRIRVSVQQDRVLMRLTQGGITVSGGVASYKMGMTEEELIELADKKLYRAKKTGRNRIVV